MFHSIISFKLLLVERIFGILLLQQILFLSKEFKQNSNINDSPVTIPYILQLQIFCKYLVLFIVWSYFLELRSSYPKIYITGDELYFTHRLNILHTKRPRICCSRYCLIFQHSTEKLSIHASLFQAYCNIIAANMRTKI